MMDTEDDITLEEELLKMEPNREINPGHSPHDKDKCGEASKQDEQPTRAADRENPRKCRQKETPTLPAEERIKQAQKAIDSLKNIPITEPAQHPFRYRVRANIRADEEFKNDVKHIRKRPEEDYINALSRFHQRQIISFKRELQRGKRP